MIQHLCAHSLVVLIVLPFTAPFVTFDLIDVSASGNASRTADAVSVLRQLPFTIRRCGVNVSRA